MEKSVDRQGRYRHTIVAFRVSDHESDMINEAVALSGLTKQEYIVSKLLNRDVVVENSPRTFKALNDRMKEILSELRRLQSAGELSADLMESIEYVTTIYTHTKEELS